MYFEVLWGVLSLPFNIQLLTVILCGRPIPKSLGYVHLCPEVSVGGFKGPEQSPPVPKPSEEVLGESMGSFWFLQDIQLPRSGGCSLSKS